MKNQNSTKHADLNLSNVDHVSSNVRPSRYGAVLYVFEGNEAVIKMIIKGRSPTMRHVSQTHRVALDCLTGLTLILKFKFDTLTPNTNSQTC